MAATTHSVAAATLLALAATMPARGQVGVRGVNLFVYGGGYSPQYFIYNLNNASTDALKTGFLLGGGVGVEIHPNVELRAVLTGAQSPLQQSGTGTGVYLNRYFLGVDVKGHAAVANDVSLYALAGGGGAKLYAKGTTGASVNQGYGHLGGGVAYAVRSQLSVFVQGDGFLYSLSGFPSGALAPYSSAQLDLTWTAGASYKLPL